MPRPRAGTGSQGPPGEMHATDSSPIFEDRLHESVGITKQPPGL